MIEENESCFKIGQQFSAVSKALDRTYLRMTVCVMSQEFEACLAPDEKHKANLAVMMKDLEALPGKGEVDNQTNAERLVRFSG